MEIKFLETAGESIAGRKRKHNEDNFLICRHRTRPALLALVADGIGGHAHGETASRICCADMLDEALSVPDAVWDEKWLTGALERINRKIFDRNFNEKRPYPAGCTVTAAVFTPQEVITANAGDSRIYEFDTLTGSLTRLTTDHRPDQKLIAKLKTVVPDISEKKINAMILRSLGSRHYLDLDITRTIRRKECSYMLCSDGLYCRLSDEKLQQIFAQHHSARTLTAGLMRAALLSGSTDNITIISCTPIQEKN